MENFVPTYKFDFSTLEGHEKILKFAIKYQINYKMLIDTIKNNSTFIDYIEIINKTIVNDSIKTRNALEREIIILNNEIRNLPECSSRHNINAINRQNRMKKYILKKTSRKLYLMRSLYKPL